MRERELFLLFVVYSIVPLFVSLVLILSKLTNWIPLIVRPTDLFSNFIHVCVIIIPWILFFMNSHLYFIKKIKDAGLSRIFLSVTIIQGIFSLFALIFLLVITFF